MKRSGGSSSVGLGFKYHVVTIAAIFFALTIGLVVGSLFGSPRVPQTTVIAIEALKKSQAVLEKNTADVKQERDALQTCLRQSLPLAIKGRLNGLSCALVQTSGDASELTPDIRETLTQAGARITSVTLLERTFNQPDELLVPHLADNSQLPTNRNELCSRLARILKSGETFLPPAVPDTPPHGNPTSEGNMPQGSATSSGGSASNNGMEPNGGIALLQDAGLLRSEPDSRYDVPVHTVILLTGSRSEGSNLAQYVDAPLIAALQKTGIAVYACEAQDVTTSGFLAYRASGLQVTTVERANTDPGHWQLVTALATSNP